jgi:hypothetical protein
MASRRRLRRLEAVTTERKAEWVILLLVAAYIVVSVVVGAG